MSKINKIFFCCLSVVLIFVSMCPSAFATDYDIVFPFSEPYVSDNQGYIVYEMIDSEGNLYYYLYYITCIPTNYVDTSADGSNNLPSAKPLFRVLPTSVSDGKTTFPIFVGIEDNYSYMVQGTFYYSSGRPYYQDPHFIQGGGTAIGYNLSYVVPLDLTFNNYYCKGPFMTAADVVPFEPILNVGFSGDNDYYNELQQIINSLATLVANDEVKLQALNEMLEDFNTLISNTDELESKLDIANEFLEFIRDYVKIYLPEIADVLWYIDTDLLVIQEKLDKIIELLSSSGESNLTSPDTSNLDNYYEVEQSLINRSDVDVSNAVNVEIDQNAMTFTWNLVETIMNSNGKVFGLTLTVLSLGIIALILGR